MEHHEMRLLADYLQPAAQAANVWARPTPLAVGGELEQNERGEVVFAEIIPPVAAGLTDEDLRRVRIILDGHETGEYISLSGIRTTLMAPLKERIFGGRLYSFGIPHNSNPLKNTTLKYKQNVTVACLAGPNALGITGAAQAYRIRLWGYVYKAHEIPQLFGIMGGVRDLHGGLLHIDGKPVFAQLIDRARGRTMNLVGKGPLNDGHPVDADSWLTLPGGKDQAVPKINPFARYAYNAGPTDGLQGDYQFRFATGGVGDENENLYWEFDEKDALLIKGLGVSPSFDTLIPPLGVFPNLARTGLRIGGDYHPKGPTTRLSLFPTDAAGNPLNYGWYPVVVNAAAPVAPLDIYAAIPKLEPAYLIWNEIGYVTIRDTGVALVPVPADPLGVTVALTGIRIEMRS